jgi:ubiquinone/menaquinone biosynthesis C-methylase UbiE
VNLRDLEETVNAPDFYTAFARLYDGIARAPGVGRVRERFATALAPETGDTVLDLGCGTGANHRYIRPRIGEDGTYLGLDFSPGVLRIARQREAEPGTHEAGPRTHFLRGDATSPPVCRVGDGEHHVDSAVDGTSDHAPPVDAACASFLVGMLADPAAAVRSWARLVGSGGRLALVNLSRTARGRWRFLNPLFRLFVRLGTPPGDGSGTAESPVETLERRVEAAHTEIVRVCHEDSLVREQRALGFARITAGTVRPETEWPSR